MKKHDHFNHTKTKHAKARRTQAKHSKARRTQAKHSKARRTQVEHSKARRTQTRHKKAKHTVSPKPSHRSIRGGTNEDLPQKKRMRRNTEEHAGGGGGGGGGERGSEELYPTKEFAKCLDVWNKKLAKHAQEKNQCTFQFRLEDGAESREITVFFKLHLVRVDMDDVVATTKVVNVGKAYSTKEIDLDTHRPELYNLGLQSMTLAMTFILLGLIPDLLTTTLVCVNKVSVYIAAVYEPITQPNETLPSYHDKDDSTTLLVLMQKARRIAPQVLNERIAIKTKLAEVCRRTDRAWRDEILRLHGTARQLEAVKHIYEEYVYNSEFDSLFHALFSIMHQLTKLNASHLKFLHAKFVGSTHALSGILATVTHKLSRLPSVDLQSVRAIMASLTDSILEKMRQHKEPESLIQKWRSFSARFRQPEGLANSSAKLDDTLK